MKWSLEVLYYHMASESEVVPHDNEVWCFVRIICPDVTQDIKLDLRLPMELFFVPDYFQSHEFFQLVIISFENLPEWSTSQSIDEFISVTYVVIHHRMVISFIVVIPIIEFTIF